MSAGKEKIKILQDTTTVPPEEFNKTECRQALKKFRDELFDLQNIFFADSRYSILIILQGMDAAGKDSTIRRVFTSMNPMGVNVKSFVKPTDEELKHDFMWRVYPHFPAKGMIQVFNRSHYEDVIVPFVQSDLDQAKIEKRYKLINQIEENLTANNTIILKFYLHISLEEQKKRIEERESRIEKRWKFSVNDRHSEKKWNEYLHAYSSVIEKCNHIPWHIIPADKKWYKNFLIGEILLRQLRSLNLKYPV